MLVAILRGHLVLLTCAGISNLKKVVAVFRALLVDPANTGQKRHCHRIKECFRSQAFGAFLNPCFAKPILGNHKWEGFQEGGVCNSWVPALFLRGDLLLTGSLLELLRLLLRPQDGGLLNYCENPPLPNSPHCSNFATLFCNSVAFTKTMGITKTTKTIKMRGG